MVWSGRSFAILSIIGFAVVAACLWEAHGAPLNWDEVDYVTTARSGFINNYLDAASLAPGDFARFAKAKLDHTPPSFPANYRESEDPLVGRHYHPPLPVYLLSFVAHAKGERVIRSVQLVGAALFLCVLLWGYTVASAHPSWEGGVTVSVLGLWSGCLLFDSFTFHGWAALWAVLVPLGVVQWLHNRSSRVRALALCGAVAAAVVTLETGAVLLGSVVLSIAIWSRDPTGKLPWRTLVVGTVVCAALVIALWPGALIKISVLKTLLLYLYRIKLGEEYAPVRDLWSQRALRLIPALVSIVPAIVFLVLWRRADTTRWGPFLVVGIVYGLFVSPFVLADRYIVPALAPLFCVVGVAVDEIRSRTVRFIPACVLGALLLATTRPPAGSNRSDFDSDMRWLGERLHSHVTFADGAHVMRFYLGSDYDIRSATVSLDGSELSERKAGAYRALAFPDLRGKWVVIQNVRESFFAAGGGETLLLQPCERFRLHTVTVYECTERQALAPFSARRPLQAGH